MSRLRHWWSNLGYDLGFFVGTCLPTSLIVWTLTGFNSQVPRRDDSTTAQSEPQTFEQAVQELSDEFIVVKSPTVNLSEIN
jgi:hypothetical protein